MDSTPLWLVHFVKSHLDTENVMHRGRLWRGGAALWPELGGPKPRDTAAAAARTQRSCPPQASEGHGLADTDGWETPSLQSVT